jgi:hypothetical protein
MTRMLGISVLLLFVPGVALADWWGGNSPLHHALWPDHDEKLVVAGQIVSVPDKREFQFRVNDVILGAQSFDGTTLTIGMNILWPKQIVSYEKGANCVLVLEIRKGRLRNDCEVYTVVAGRNREYSQAHDTLEAREILADELLAQLAVEKNPLRQRALLLQVAPILTRQKAESLERFADSSDARVRRSALVALVYATEDPKYLKSAARDVQAFMDEAPEKESVEVRGANGPMQAPQRALFEDYFFLNPRSWTWGSIWIETEAEKHLRILDGILKNEIIDQPSQAILFGNLPVRDPTGAFQIIRN